MVVGPFRVTAGLVPVYGVDGGRRGYPPVTMMLLVGNPRNPSAPSRERPARRSAAAAGPEHPLGAWAVTFPPAGRWGGQRSTRPAPQRGGDPPRTRRSARPLEHSMRRARRGI